MKIASLIMALSAVTLAVPAAAAAEPQLKVKYSDLDLSTEAGQATLNRRIDQSARQLCGRGVSTGTILSSGRAKDCYERARTSAHQMIAERVARESNAG